MQLHARAKLGPARRLAMCETIIAGEDRRKRAFNGLVGTTVTGSPGPRQPARYARRYEWSCLGDLYRTGTIPNGPRCTTATRTAR
jgi:hypothetical protein